VFQNGLVIRWAGWMGWYGVFSWRLQAIRRFRLTLNRADPKPGKRKDFGSAPIFRLANLIVFFLFVEKSRDDTSTHPYNIIHTHTHPILLPFAKHRVYDVC
jgi:hypothetical protein